MRKTLNPIYDEDFTFFGINSNQLQTTVLHFVVLSFDRYSRDEIIGEIFCQLNLLEFDSLEKQIVLSRDICPRSHKVWLQWTVHSGLMALTIPLLSPSFRSFDSKAEVRYWYRCATSRQPIGSLSSYWRPGICLKWIWPDSAVSLERDIQLMTRGVLWLEQILTSKYICSTITKR